MDRASSSSPGNQKSKNQCRLPENLLFFGMELIERTVEFVKKELRDAEGGHDWFHTLRVLELSRRIAAEENADQEICQLGALLHDIADPKFHSGDEEAGLRIASGFLRENGVPEDRVTAVLHIIENISFSKSFDSPKELSAELKVVQDADRLDAMGAIGIARAFNYGGFRNRPMYDPEIPPANFTEKSAYRSSNSPTLNHFHEKLLLLKDRMNTRTGKEMAESRHAYMLNFLEEFHKEWKGEH